MEKTPAIKLKFPMVNGKPDTKHGVLQGVKVVYDIHCGRYETEKIVH